MDKGYDADRIRERLSYDGVRAVIPRYRERNRSERFF